MPDQHAMPVTLPDKLKDLPPQGAVVDLDAGPTFVATVGTGPLVVVLHGGPGFDHRYLVRPLASLAARRTLIFFDQPGCGRTPAQANLTPDAVFEHFGALATELLRDRRVGVVAHSWGSLVFLAGCARMPAEHLPCFSEGVLVNPVPPSRKAYDHASARLVARAPDVAAEFYRAIQSGADGSEAMKAVLPYYSPGGFAETVEHFPLATATFLSVSSQMADFDLSGDLAPLRHLTVICGLDDFVSADLIDPILRSAKRAHLLPEIGHFPFFEAPDAFAGLIDGIFTPLDQGQAG